MQGNSYKLTIRIKYILFIIFNLFITILNAEEFKREGAGFSETEEFSFQNNKVIHYKNKTTWKDSLGNYGISECLGLIVSNKDNNIIDYKMYCKYLDQDKDEYTHKYERENEFSVGVGNSIIISGTGKWINNIGFRCTYAIDYLERALFIVEKCNNKGS